MEELMGLSEGLSAGLSAPTMQLMQHLKDVTHAEIKEEIQPVEAMAALLGQEIEMANKYQIVDSDSGNGIFSAIEKTDFVTRQMGRFCPDCAPWNVDLTYDGAPAFKLEKPWTLSCCCFNRPVMTVQDAQGNPVGSVVDPFTCCNLAFHARDSEGKDVATIDGGCCQWGLLCPCPLGPGSRVTMDIQASDGRKIGEIVKKKSLKWFIQDDVDNYSVTFGEVDEIAKLLVLAVSIFMDFKYFNESARDESLLPET